MSFNCSNGRVALMEDTEQSATGFASASALERLPFHRVVRE